MDIVNIIAKDKLPIKRKLSNDDFKRLLKQSRIHWEEMDCKKSYFIMARVSKMTVSLYANGTVFMAGLKSIDQAEQFYSEVLIEFKRLFKGSVI